MYCHKTTSEEFRHKLFWIHVLLQTYDYKKIYHSMFKPVFVLMAD